MPPSIYDAAIVGGGPAGCSAAITLAAQGARVVLFEAKLYAHDKLCGEFLSPECAGLLSALGLAETLQALGPATIDVAALSAPDGAVWETRLPGSAWGLTRRALDSALADRARALGVTVREGCTATGLTGNLAEGFAAQVDRRGSGEPGGERRSSVRARAIIAAHGKRGLLDRALGRRTLRQPQPFVALKAHVRGLALPGRIELHAFPGGYCGMSEIESRAYPGPRAANVCLLAHESVFQNAGGHGPNRVPDFLRWMRAQNPRLEARLAGTLPAQEHWLSIAQVPFERKAPVEGDVLMAGDAAGVIAPLAGDGIAMALRSGQLAAGCTAAYLSGRLSAAALPQAYAAVWQREFGGRLRLGRFLQAWLLRPAWLSRGLRLLNLVPRLGQYLLTHTRTASNAGAGFGPHALGNSRF